ncbi:RTA1 like protein-domain-containing protein [Penicillium atrosanguineum]|uniref:FAD/NAD(P)-binding domain-containing protein n=1 Tax=Penicillium atrosanguineum TaxID=1132637 RepID=A0A9W9PT34_9EURO|nr:RTA1 like protein-domain-containing protein [Penicillium atrosanguineum]KAJ5300311.1 RTA1 like protein-domain-containing protein [Penicillium atrosanguineum]KAJ5310951.1 FAD/NAD(P)-binding domain-containing protein [Penicillium atrosanguineum]
MTVTQYVRPDGITEPRSSGVDVIIVGLGIAGLVAAIECHYKGHKVVGLEKSHDVKVLGDSIALGSNAAKVLQHWDNGRILNELTSQSDDVAAMEILDPAGKLYAMDSMDGYGFGEGMIIHRGTLVNELYRHARSLAIDLRFGSAITQYWENDGHAGVVVNGDQRLSADCVIGADGVHSKTRDFVLGYQIKPQASGLAAYRACFSAKLVSGDSEASWVLEEAGLRDRMRRYITDGGLGLTLATGKRGQNIIWQIWHRNDTTSEESWENTTKAHVDDALALIQDWPVYSRVAAVLRHTPSDKLADYKIISRDPLPTWISQGGRVMIIGDAAHAMSPIVGQGGGQSIEDAATLAICLELAGKTQVKSGLQAVEAFRHQRTRIIQESGNAIYSQMRDPDWAAIEQDPSMMKFPRPQWIFDYDVYRDVYKEFPAVIRAVQDGTKYRPQNIHSDCK